jgi:crotonobetainyl-CoA:carnitine CoA-transferase CaiB-like acyl-CoA transferase
LSTNAGPLAGTRVIDLTSVVMGPWATHVLADYGADVIKIEPPGGDIIRTAGPMRNPLMGPVFLNSARGKRSVVLDLKRAPDRAALLKLCANADVFMHNVRRQAMARLDLGYETVARANPAIVYVSLLGYDREGPKADLPAYDDLMQGACGLASLFALAGGAAPQFVPALIADRYVGVTAVNAVLAALLERNRTGAGQAIDVPMFETMVELVLSDHLGGHTFEPPIGPFGYQRTLSPFRRPYRTSDGFVCVLLYNDAHWDTFFRITGNGDRYRSDSHLCDPEGRRSDFDRAYATVAEIVATRSTGDWIELLRANDVPVAEVNELAALLHEPQLTATGFIATHDHPSEGRIRSVRSPARFGGTRPEHSAAAPRLGEHTLEVLREAGLDEASIHAIAGRGGMPPVLE